MKYRDALEAVRSTYPVSKCNDIACVANSKACPKKPGTVLRINIPPGAEINLLNLIEVSSPGGICIIVRLPFLSGLLPGGCSKSDLAGILESIKLAGGSVEVVNQ